MRGESSKSKKKSIQSVPFREINVKRIPKGQSKMDNPEKLAT